jgi:succinate-semialdehyde dehydrogenase/glutarate-semialdehyde dehydrogenase
MRAYREELFGPVAVVYRVSSDEDRAIAVADRLDVGMANVNTAAAEGADVPFGGTKRSGFGRELGPLGIGEFVNKRIFYVQR